MSRCPNPSCWVHTKSWCLNPLCTERRDGRGGRWWEDFGTCSRRCAESYYGEEAVD